MTNEERRIVRGVILLGHMETMVQRSIDDISTRPNVLKPLYQIAGDLILRQITDDKYRTRRALKQRNIRIEEDEQSDFVMYHRCFCRGYQERFGMTRDVIRSEISVMLASYVSELTGAMKVRRQPKSKPAQDAGGTA